MRKVIIFLLSLLLILNVRLFAQEKTDGCNTPIRKISTNPLNPVNEEWEMWYPNDVGSYVNTWFSWYPRNQIVIPKEQNWNSSFLRSGNNIVMPWLFSNSNTRTGYLYINPNHNPDNPDEPTFIPDEERDWHWEDGWELLYLNIGYLPNGTQIGEKSDPNDYWNNDEELPSPPTAPYVVLYNRYTGLMRVFFSVWLGENINWGDVTVSLEFQKDIIELGKISGLLRHANGLDQPLNEPSKITRITSARKQSINSQNEWYVAEFQLAYDPCQCSIGSLLTLKFKYTKESTVDLNIRTIALEQGIADLDEDYWNFFQSMVNEDGTTSPGNILYPTMSSMSDAYDQAMVKYKSDLNDYQDPINLLKAGAIKALTDGVAGGIAGLIVPQTVLLRDFILNNQIKIGDNKILLPQDTAEATNWAASIESSAKMVLAQESDFISGMLGVKQKPIPPQMPVATFTEGRITGSIIDTKEQNSVALIVPGSMKTPDGISAHNFPSYNQTLGLFAMLDTPTFRINTYDPNLSAKWDPRLILQPINIHYAINPALDFDLRKTSLLGAITITVLSEPFNNELDYSPLYSHSNFKLNHRFINSDGYMESEYISTFYDLEDIRNVIFRLDFLSVGVFGIYGIPSYGVETSIKNIKFKVAADMYFNQIGSNGEQVSNFQVFTYNIFDNSNVDLLSKVIEDNGGVIESTTNWVNYLPGLLELNTLISPSDEMVWNVVGNKIYIKAESVHITQTVGPVEGYELIIEAMNIQESPDAVLLKNTKLISKQFYDNPKLFPIINSNDLPEGYCQNTYQANVSAYKTSAGETDAIGSLENEREPIPAFLETFPNPTTNELNIIIKNGHFKSCSVQLTSASGQLVFMEELGSDLTNAFAIDVSNIPNGFYVVNIVTNTGEGFQKTFIVNK